MGTGFITVGKGEKRRAVPVEGPWSNDRIRSGKPQVVTETIHEEPTEIHIHKKRVWIKPHDEVRDGKTFHIDGHWEEKHELHFKEKGKTIRRKQLKFGGNFAEVEKHIYNYYMKKVREHKINPRTGKPYTKAEAKAIAYGTAADIYRGKEAKYYEEGNSSQTKRVYEVHARYNSEGKLEHMEIQEK